MPSPMLLVHDDDRSHRKSVPSRRGAISSPNEGIAGVLEVLDLRGDPVDHLATV
jgi:hypothetical protein